MSTIETSPFETKLILLIGDLAQLPPICKHTLRQNDMMQKLSCKIYVLLENGTTNFFVHINVSCHKSRIPTIS
jgi:hypothetical protein